MGLLGICAMNAAAEENTLRAHEWGTFTTLHKGIGGQGLPWYQTAKPNVFNAQGFPIGNVSDLPGFVHGNVGFKLGLRQTARMETPVIYFYSDKRQTIDLSVAYPEGQTTEFYPKMKGSWNQWKGLEIIPPSEAGDLIKSLPVDPKLPDNHYYEARAVPDAAIVRMQFPTEPDEKPRPDEWERFLFYRGMGTFETGLTPFLASDGKLSVSSRSREFEFKHVWMLKTTRGGIRWEKLPEIGKYDRSRPNRVERNLNSLSNDSVDALKSSMIAALEDAGLTHAEAAAMVATWDSQWYEEPGQRVFSIVPQNAIDQKLPLTITPKPAEVVRVFVHRQELLSPETLASLEEVMKPGAEPETTRKVIEGEQLGRFVHGAIDSVAADVGQRTTMELKDRLLNCR